MNTNHCRIDIAFPLTLTLSRREREQPLANFVKLQVAEQFAAVASPESWERFSLSPRERVGVRGNNTSIFPN